MMSAEVRKIPEIGIDDDSTITPITLQPKLKPIHGFGTLKFGYLVNSHLPKTRTDVSLRRSAVVASAITGASETVKVSNLRGNEIPISDLWKDRKAVVSFARHFGWYGQLGFDHEISDEAEKEMEEEEELLLSLSRRKQMVVFLHLHFFLVIVLLVCAKTSVKRQE
ncbi:hypothetical protein DY000_02024031 [Brassica cretica]|uniref:Uncharacterized protein n=1 Tax=Brassica cretica TaxID=69181 RepID=A0ABQ7EB36_BRACR|nr:hypothetical protein DY000_02024031 [Brassica cretica]